MSGYVGRGINYGNAVADHFTGNGGATYTLSYDTTTNGVVITLDGVVQKNGTDFNIAGTALTFTTVVASPIAIQVIYTGLTLSIGTPGDGTVTNAKVDNSAAIATSKISGAVTSIASHGLGTSATVDTGTSANQIVKLDGSAKIPAVDGSQLTNLPSDVTKATSDPVITTNPSGGVGTLYLNKNSGELWCCTDATSNKNKWINIASGDGDIVPYVFQGANYGFQAGGYIGGSHNGIWRFAFASDGNATDWADMATGRETTAGSHSDTHGYTLGGSSNVNNIEKFQFSSAANATDIADLSNARHKSTGHSTATHGYCSAGENASGNTNEIDKHSLSADTDATDVGDVTVSRAYVAGASSSSHGYTAGGTTGSVSNIIDKFSFTSDGNSTDVADLLAANSGPAGTCSETYGYTSAGYTSTYVNPIEKYSFASDSNSTDVGDVTVARAYVAGVSSTTHGYTVGGWTGAYEDEIDKFAFASDGNATDVGNLISGRFNSAGIED